ncbi:MULTISPECIES: c-type cytochrome [unclassified Pseudodesulfovibrio]|uniref:c-type cytochrome n=1 Tax=unclassified Pseudodesulfovibrio TaxID=2661612 RepID=UPI000FEBD9C5|nr:MULTISPECIES: c-type cytochrome [unclassified Pseudodesulfovibrio]MCJ2164513.1 c-type cytochrome [Pseudodesulfovibrio sp. S3-i]RWU04712.1 cytochrome c class I [Pseudodesulfovibrio sp. S3]
MKKLFIVLTAICCFGVTAAFAVDGGELYQKRCAKCHRDGSESSAAGGDVVLKGQSAGEIEMKLTGYVDGTYGGKKKKTMERVASGLSAEETKALATYIGSL